MEAKPTFDLEQTQLLCGNLIFYFNISGHYWSQFYYLGKEKEGLKGDVIFRVINLISAISKLPDPLGGKVIVAFRPFPVIQSCCRTP